MTETRSPWLVYMLFDHTLSSTDPSVKLAWGLGTARKNRGAYDDELKKVTELAIKVGYRHLDGAESTFPYRNSHIPGQ